MNRHENQVGGEEVNVVFVLKKDAKYAKGALEESGWLNKDFRMVPAIKSGSEQQQETLGRCIAIPVVDPVHIDQMSGILGNFIVSTGRQVCPLSTKLLGNRRALSHTSFCGEKLNLVQQALVNAILVLSPGHERNNFENSKMIDRLKLFDRNICPNKLQFFGDDKTLVLPPKSFEGEEFDMFLSDYINLNDSSKFSSELWKQLAIIHSSPRVVRRGIVDKDSGIRESGHRLLFPSSGVSDETGPNSPGWIQVTEQGIRQSFDMTRVMFSRGNISEKIRFGRLVSEGETVLDMYAGIGYYTLPALVIGKAKHVYACEWNVHAANALRFNLKDNRVADRATVLAGDCRLLIQQNSLVNMFDRVSLGLLPSSEGGWSAAVRSLRSDTGGWLHIHGNVPTKEVESWAFWVCSRLRTFTAEAEKPTSWVVVCEHVEKVKSFAPTVAHYVADFYLGPDGRYFGKCPTVQQGQAAVIVDGKICTCPDIVESPSCALSPNNVLSQEWLR